MIEDPYIKYLASQYLNPAFVDSVGNGAIFGCLVACAVMNPNKFWLNDVNDSKKLKHREIYRIAPILKRNIIYSLGIVSAEEIREIKNIFKAEKIAMKKAIKGLPVKPDAVFVDGKYTLPEYNSYAIIRGDSRNFGIACASIIAKDYRDHFMMENYPGIYEWYDIKKNFGYKSPKHFIAIRKYGLTDNHRFWFPQIKRVLSGDYDPIIHQKYQHHWEKV